jgi:predicted nuclease of predicted toxin-antitoxin system
MLHGVQWHEYLSNNENKTWFLRRKNIPNKADMRMVLHARICKENVVIVSKDTDVLIILVWAYVKFSVKNMWYMKFDNNIC